MRQRLEIAIAGCGPAGMSAAIQLAALGHRIRVFDQFDAVRPVGSGLMLQPTGLAVLETMGLEAEMEAIGQPVARLFGKVAPTGRVVLDVRFAQGIMRPLAVHRAALFDVLFGKVRKAGLEVDTGVVVASVERASDRRPRLVDGRGRRHGPFDLVVDALGARSPLTGEARRPVRARPLHYGALWASLPRLEGDPFLADALEQRYHRASVMVGVLPVGRISPGGENQLTFFWSLKPAAYEAWRARGLAAWKDDVRAVWPAVSGLLERIGDPMQLTLAAYAHRTMPVPAGDRIVYVGDSAHSTSPQLGQGANMALLDTFALAAALERHEDVAAALTAYAKARRFHVAAYQSLSAVFTPFYQSDSRVLPILRDRLVGPLTRLPGANGVLARLVAGRLPDPLPGLGLASLAKAIPVSLDRAAERD